MSEEKRLVRVEWLDAACDNSWRMIGEEKGFQSVPVTTVGWLFHENERVVVIVGTATEDQFNQSIIIPKEGIVSIKGVHDGVGVSGDGD
jgi:aryl-alcohol dehydrogenase-like predicted oxidoreductase